MTKEEITARLQELAAVLGRDADISGSKADLEQRLAEWEEELSDGSDGLYKDDEEPQQKTKHDPNVGRVRTEILWIWSWSKLW